MRIAVVLILVGAAWAGRNPVPYELAELIGTADVIAIARVDRARRFRLETVLYGKPDKLTRDIEIRDPKAWRSGAKAPTLDPGRRYVVFIEGDGKAGTNAGFQPIGKDGVVVPNGLLGDRMPIAKFRKAIAGYLDPAYRARLLKLLKEGKPAERHEAIRKVCQLRMGQAAPLVLAFVRDGPEPYRRTALKYALRLDNKTVVPAYVDALSIESARDVAAVMLATLKGARREEAVRELKRRIPKWKGETLATAKRLLGKLEG